MAENRDGIADVWGPRAPYLGEGRWPHRVDQYLEEKPDEWIRSCCVLCSNGCGLDIGVKDGRIVGVRGLKTDRVNRGRLGPKGLQGFHANRNPDRLLLPLVRENGQLREGTWDEAMARVVERCRQTIEQFTPGGVAIYNSGQLFLEEYYTLSLVAQGGIGTPHLDGNTRLCTATAAQALRETFGTDGQPCSYTDLDVTDCLLLVGSNMAETQTVLWARVLDRLDGPKAPKLVVVDPRRTPTAAKADVHLRPRLGTNVALLNGILRHLIGSGYTDPAFLEKHTVGFDCLTETVANYPPERVEEITGVPARDLVKAADIIGTSKTLVSCVLQGVYQSNQATAAACQVNNVNLILGRIGRSGCGIMQMNGQPTAQNTRETGCDGEFPFFLNWQNVEHVQRWAKLWNVDPMNLPKWHLHSHAMEIFRHCELGSVRFLWVIGTNPAVSLPELHKIRRTLAKPDLFLVVSDAYLTETAEYADVVLPAAIWGEKTGCFTNIDRTVHISHKAIEPPGEARSDLDTLLDFAHRMDFRDRDGQPLVKWKDAAGAFKSWVRHTKGWFCDYSGLSYEKLSQGTGIQWPCNAKNPEGSERIYADFKFKTAAAECETFGHDIESSAPLTPDWYKAHDPNGRAILKPAKYSPPLEEPDREYPFFLTTGRVVYQFHTRTKTGRCQDLNAAAPEPFVEMCAADAKRLKLAEGDMAEVASRRGILRLPVKIVDILPGHLFVPFHYGYWDAKDQQPHRAANELTITAWDPVSKQPYFKYAAVQIRRARRSLAALGRAVADAASKAIDQGGELADKILSTAHAPRTRVPDYIDLFLSGCQELAGTLRALKDVHFEEVELVGGFETMAKLAEEASEGLAPFGEKRGEIDSNKLASLRAALFTAPRPGPFGILRDLHAITVLISEVQTSVIVLIQIAQGVHDSEMLDACMLADERVKQMHSWTQNHIKHRAVHTLVVPA